MKKFNKTLLATALMIAAGSASANISVDYGNSELFLSVYDSSSKNTYSYNTGLTIDAFIVDASNPGYVWTYDLSSDNNWTSGFLGAVGFNAATTTYALAVANTINPDALITSSAVGGLVLTDTIDTLVGTIQNQAGLINPIGISKVVNDAAAPNSGQFNQFNDAFGVQTGAQVAGAYNVTGTLDGDLKYLGFFHATNVPNAAEDALEPRVEQFLQQWELTGNTLTFAAPVPLPAAVWMFGAGMLGMLRLNRRKSMAV